MLPRWLDLALDARIHREHLYLLLDADKLHAPEFDIHRLESTRLADEAGYLAPTIPMPALLRGDDELEEFFQNGQDRWYVEHFGRVVDGEGRTKLSKELLHRILDGSYRPQDKQNFSRADHAREMWQAFEESNDWNLKAEIFHHVVSQFQFQPTIDGAPDILQKVKDQFKGLTRIYRTAERKEWAELSSINGHPCLMRAVGPFDDGVAAAASGKSIESNPYSSLDTDSKEYAKWFAWRQGWKAHYPHPWYR